MTGDEWCRFKSSHASSCTATPREPSSRIDPITARKNGGSLDSMATMARASALALDSGRSAFVRFVAGCDYFL